MDELDILNQFSLDMVSTDMNFEQAYSMYNHLQQENALSAVENLQKIQESHHIKYDDAEPMDQLHEDEEDEDENDYENENDNGNEDDDEQFDKFFSNTESNALEKFLDNLANPTSSNPLELYHHDFSFKPKSLAKSDLTNAFAHPPSNSIFKEPEESVNRQLPTPESRQSSIDEDFDIRPKRSYGDMDLDSPKKKKRPATKPLLSLEQKRLNHSHSEQKRRQLCKLAYERCLRLITNFETYSKLPPTTKKSKRKQFTKDGLPNLSKHCALMKISNEIMKIQGKNEAIKDLLRANLA